MTARSPESSERRESTDRGWDLQSQSVQGTSCPLVFAIQGGPLSDELVGTSMGVTLRRVTNQDPETATVYIYLTNLPLGVPPGIVALLCKSRWDVEKVFDEFKNKLGETKSWASNASKVSPSAP
jgi:hypothetical protein